MARGNDLKPLLFDRQTAPEELTNLADRREFRDLREALARRLAGVG